MVARRRRTNGAAVRCRVLEANFTNERGVGGTFRFLKNVAGLWILECCRREWRAAGLDADMTRLLDGAAALPESVGVVYPDASRFFNPASMVDELRGALTEAGQPAPMDPVALTKVCLDSLALRYGSVIGSIERLTVRLSKASTSWVEAREIPTSIRRPQMPPDARCSRARSRQPVSATFSFRRSPAGSPPFRTDDRRLPSRFRCAGSSRSTVQRGSRPPVSTSSRAVVTAVRMVYYAPSLWPKPSRDGQDRDESQETLPHFLSVRQWKPGAANRARLEKDIEPVSLSDDGTTWTFELEADQPFVYFKPCLIRGEGRHWSCGPTNSSSWRSPTSAFPIRFLQSRAGTLFGSRRVSVPRSSDASTGCASTFPPDTTRTRSLTTPLSSMHSGHNLSFPQEAFMGHEWQVDDTSRTLAAMCAVEECGVHRHLLGRPHARLHASRI